MSRNIKSTNEISIPESFELLHEEYVSDCKACGFILRHKKNHARICILSNDDENKAFAIAFRTPPTDDTGVAHITEHSVLCGSKKFPVRDPFIELAKGSLNTFLNALTFPDKTCYPVASCNDKDLANLMDVYLDAVFNPLLYEHEEIFKQEGWHYEINSPDEPVTVNGIVYSEMKGAFSSPDNRLSRGVLHAMFPDTTYGVESGGSPEAIPTLTYKDFVNFHKKYYHPTNSYIYLYGNIDIEERLGWLDREYLSKYDYQPVDSEIAYQQTTEEKNVVDYYPISDDEPEENATFLNWSKILGKSNEIEKNIALDVICDCLFNVPGAPIRERLVSSGIGQDIYCGIDNSILQSTVNLTVQNSNPDKMDELKRILFEELEKACTEGLNRDSVYGCLNRREFNYAEADFGYLPKGLMYIINSLSTWLYDDNDPFSNINRSGIYDILRNKFDTGYYEQLIRDYLLDTKNDVFYSLIPRHGHSCDDEERLAQKLADYKASLSDDEISSLIEQNRKLKEYQSTPSAAADLEKLPLLSRNDLSHDAPRIICESRRLTDNEIKFHNLETNGIIYLKLFFHADRLDRNQIQAAELMCKFFGNMNLADRGYLEYNNDVNIHTGGISSYLITFGSVSDPGFYRPFFCVDAKFMAHELEKSFELINEMVLKTDFSDLKRVRELLGETKARMKTNFAESGHHVARSRALAEISDKAAFDEITDGLTYYRFVCDTLELDDEGLLGLIDVMNQIRSSIFAADNCFVDITCNEKLYSDFSGSYDKLLGAYKKLGSCGGDHRGPVLKFPKCRQAFRYSGKVNFLFVCGKTRQVSQASCGRMNVIKNMLSSEYLWNNVRMLGGAYGAGFSFISRSRAGYFYSYRDPNLKKTLETYKNASEYVRQYAGDDREILKAIIGTIGGMDTPMNPNMKGEVSLMMTLDGTTQEMLQEKRDAIINITLDDIHSMAEVIEDIFSEPSICAVASEGSLDTDGDMFEHIESLF